MVNHAALGTTGAPFRMDVERGKIREFAKATKSTNPAYWDREPPLVPATFLTTLLHWEPVDQGVWGSVEMDQQRGLQAEQEFEFFGPPPEAGTVLTGQSRISDIYVKPGRRGGELTFAVLTTEFRDPDGRLVAVARMTGVETAQPPTEDHAHADAQADDAAGGPA